MRENMRLKFSFLFSCRLNGIKFYYNYVENTDLSITHPRWWALQAQESNLFFKNFLLNLLSDITGTQCILITIYSHFLLSPCTSSTIFSPQVLFPNACPFDWFCEALTLTRGICVNYPLERDETLSRNITEDNVCPSSRAHQQQSIVQ